MIDYILVVAVDISAGVGALVSALPSLQRHTLGLCLLILMIIAVVNLRGVREAGKQAIEARAHGFIEKSNLQRDLIRAAECILSGDGQSKVDKAS